MKNKMMALLTIAIALPPATHATNESPARASGEVELAPVYVTRCIDASIERVWASWATAEGIRTFFARDATVEPRIDGEYSVLFFPDNPPGLRGAENMRIVALEPEERLVVTWNQPAQFAAIRAQRALVEYRLREQDDCGTEVRIKHFGWGRSEEWAAARRYFEGAWEAILNRLEYRFEHGPLDWDNVPEHLRYSGPPAASETDND